MSQLDFYFPFFVFFYGILMIFMMDNPAFQRLQQKFGRSLLSGSFQGFQRPVKFLWGLVVLSGFWAAQNLLISV